MTCKHRTSKENKLLQSEWWDKDCTVAKSLKHQKLHKLDLRTIIVICENTLSAETLLKTYVGLSDYC